MSSGFKRPVAPQGTLLKGGWLWKRQGDSHIKGQDYSGLKFKKRFIRLDKEFLYYYRGPSDKTYKDKFQVSSIEIIEEVEPGTFHKDFFYFQIGNQKEVMYFGTEASQMRSEWMEALGIAAENKMLSHYHPGVYGNGEWTCCKNTVKDIIGCQEPHYKSADTNSKEKTLNAGMARVTWHEVEKRKRVPCLIPNYRHSDTSSIDSGVECRDSMMSLNMVASTETLSGTSTNKMIKEEPIEEQDGENPVSLKMLNKHGYHLLFKCHYETAVTALDFRGTDTVIAAEKSGKVHVFDAYNCSEDQNSYSQEFDHMHSEVDSVETWKSILLISAKDAWHLRDLDNQKINKSYSQSDQLVAITPDGTRIITANENMIKVLIMIPAPSVGISSASSQSLKLPGSSLLYMLFVSPDPEIPKTFVGIAKNERLTLCVYDYTKLNDCREIDVGNYSSSHLVQTDFSSSEQKLAIGHGDKLKIFKLEEPGHHIFSIERDDSIASLKYSPDGDCLVVGLSNGNVEVLDGRANKFSLQHTFKLLAPAAVTSMAFSKDSSLLALGQRNGQLNIIKKLSTYSKKINVPSSDLEYILRLNEDDITVVFPPGFSSQPSMLFDYDVMVPELFGPECFPEGVRPVSAILELHPHDNIELKKPIKITMPHFADIENEEDCKSLAIFKACSNNYEVVDGRKIWKFKKTNINFLPVHYASVTTAERRVQSITFDLKHCCYICLTRKIEREDIKFKNEFFCITRAQKWNSDNREFSFHYCLRYPLPTCKETIKEQYPAEESYGLKDFWIKVDNGSIEVEVLCPEELRDSGWTYNFEDNCSKIECKDVNMWDTGRIVLKHMCDQKTHPPRCTLRVSALNSVQYIRNTSLNVKFPGAFHKDMDNYFTDTVELKCFSPGIANSPSLALATSGRNTGKRISRTESLWSAQTGSSFEESLPQARLGYEVSTLQSAFCFLSESEELPQPFRFALVLNSSSLLTNSQMDKLFPNEDTIEEHQKIRKKYNILRVLQENIYEDPQKFKTLCSIFKKMKWNECLQKLAKDEKERHKVSESEGDQECPQSTLKPFYSNASGKEE